MNNNPRINTLEDYYKVGDGVKDPIEVMRYVYLKNNLNVVVPAPEPWGEPLPDVVQTSEKIKFFLSEISRLAQIGEYSQIHNILMSKKDILIDNYFYFDYSWYADCIRCLVWMQKFDPAFDHAKSLISAYALPDIIDNVYADVFDVVYYLIDRVCSIQKRYFFEEDFKPFIGWLKTSPKPEHTSLIVVTDWLSRLKYASDRGSINADIIIANFRKDVVPHLPTLKKFYKNFWDLCEYYVMYGPQVKRYTQTEMLNWFKA